jgi:hypothetical protein
LAFVQLEDTLMPIEVTLRPPRPLGLAFLLATRKDTLRPPRPVRFFSPLSLEKNAPACSAFSDFFGFDWCLTPIT